MRKIIVGAQVSMDGVMQAPGGRWEDPTKGFKFGGWVMPYFFTIPVVLGGGKKLFADGSTPHSYKLTRSRVSSTGLLIGHYERAGDITIGDTAPDNPSKAEAARQVRMKREG
jgi:hypothetical protein